MFHPPSSYLSCLFCKKKMCALTYFQSAQFQSRKLAPLCNGALDSGGEFWMCAPFFSLQQLLTDMGKLELWYHMTGPAWIRIGKYTLFFYTG